MADRATWSAAECSAAPHRVLRSSTAAARAYPDERVGETTLGGVRVPLPRWSVACPTVDTPGHIEAMPLYAGESVGSVHAVQPAADIIRELMNGAEALLRSRSAWIS
jgi:NAD(P)H-dependent flavin oxidoreductase YrpB (nitropropane dioxygenase family)